jgi:hypothetical protein
MIQKTKPDLVHLKAVERMEKLVEVQLALDGLRLASRQKGCWHFVEIDGSDSCKGNLTPYTHPKFSRVYILLCEKHAKDTGWKLYE